MNAEQALTQARVLFGEPAVIANVEAPARCEVGVLENDRFVLCGQGATWDEALDAATTATQLPGSNAHRLATPPPFRDGRTKVTPPPQSSTSAGECAPGSTLGAYEILQVLGKGGMGAVYRARHVRSGQQVALKVLHEQLAHDAKLLARFESEVRALNVLRHPNIVQILDIDALPNGRPYFAMELLHGQCLLDRTGKPMTPAEVVGLLIPICDALEAAHRAEIIHRDLKPENVFLADVGGLQPVVKLLDFGIAKLCAPGLAARKTTAGTLIGTPEYMAPEQCSGAEVDARADLYALGVIAYALATGRLPFADLPITHLLFAHMTKTPVPPHEVAPSVPMALSALIMRMLAKKPDDRPRSAGELRAELDAVSRGHDRRLHVCAG